MSTSDYTHCPNASSNHRPSFFSLSLHHNFLHPYNVEARHKVLVFKLSQWLSAISYHVMSTSFHSICRFSIMSQSSYTYPDITLPLYSSSVSVLFKFPLNHSSQSFPSIVPVHSSSPLFLSVLSFHPFFHSPFLLKIWTFIQILIQGF